MTRTNPKTSSRRHFLRTSASIATGALLGSYIPSIASASRKPRIGVLMTEFTYRSHAHVILENFLEPYLFSGKVVESGCDVVSFFVDQVPAVEMSQEVAKRYGIPIYPTIAEALTCGGDDLAVDAVLAIAEHGQYPVNDHWQMEYPRKRFFDETVAVFKKTGKTAPYFNDKHLSYRWDWAKEMYDTSKEMGFAMMAGSSVPLAQRRPPIDLKIGAPIVDSVSVHGGGVESYDIHALEVLQSFNEARKGGETGVKSVQFLEGDALWKAAEEGRWSTELARAAMIAEIGDGPANFRELAMPAAVGSSPPHGILVHYRDGTRGMALKVGSSATRWNYAAKISGQSEPVATSIYVGPWQNRNLFKALSHAIQAFFHTGKAPYPVERTLLTTGIVAVAMDSRFEGGKEIETPQLALTYQARDFRDMRETGKSWEIITEEMPEPPGMDSSKERRSAL